VPKLKGKFDRIAMPLPKTGEEFLDIALKKIKPKGTIHLYAFLNEKDIKDHVKKIRQICKDLKFKIRIKKQVKCGQFSPGTFRMCFDLSILEKIKK
jgi:tRNA G37 N-methylase Trm5